MSVHVRFRPKAAVAGIYLLRGADWFAVRRRRDASNRANPQGQGLLLSSLRSAYSVTRARLSNREGNVAKCVVCLQTMDTWDSTDVPTYKLIQRPEDA